VVEESATLIERSLTDTILSPSDFVQPKDDGEFNRAIRRVLQECEVETSLLAKTLRHIKDD